MITIKRKPVALTIYLFAIVISIAMAAAPIQVNAASNTIVDPYQAYSYETMLADATELQTMYPELIRLASIGTSVEGRDLLLIEFGNGNRRIFLNGATHAREYITTSYLMTMIDQYAYAYANGGTYNGYDMKKILDGVTFAILPMVNPDGVNLVQNGLYSTQDPVAVAKIPIYRYDREGYVSWKANINGVDLNRNYPRNWYVDRTVDAPSSSRFKGYSPLSEPESMAIMRYLNSNMSWAFISFHSQGEGLYGWNDPNEWYSGELNSMVERIMEDSGFRKLSGTSDNNYGTFGDHVRNTFHKPTLTVELCKYVGSYPYPNEDFDRAFSPAKHISLIIAEEVMKLDAQTYLVFQNKTFLHAYAEEGYALAFARKWENSSVLSTKDAGIAEASIFPTDIVYSINGNDLTFSGYQIEEVDYVKLRDVAAAYSGSTLSFDVGYDSVEQSVLLTSGEAYTLVEEVQTTATSQLMQEVTPSSSTVYLDGVKIDLRAYMIGDSNYFSIEELVAAFAL